MNGNAFNPFGFQSGDFGIGGSSSSSSSSPPPPSSELVNDDSYAGSMHYDPRHNVLFFTGQTYGVYFDSATNLGDEIKDEMGMNGEDGSDAGGGRDVGNAHLDAGDCFLGVLKLPTAGGGGEEEGSPRRDGPTPTTAGIAIVLRK